jgi:acylphosphatase
MGAAETILARRAWVSGRVQGVSFRAATRAKALSLGLRGQAVNLPDGRVEVWVCGDAHAVQALLEWLRIGPPAARVDAVQIMPADAEGCPEVFQVG